MGQTVCKGLVLSGGRGGRLRPLTATQAKQLIPIANKPILFYGLEALAAAGVTDVGIVVGDTWREVQAAVGEGSRFGIRATYIRQEEPLGLAHAVLCAEEFLQGDRFVMYLGDNLILGGIAHLVQGFSHSQANAHILVARVSNPSQFGVAVVEGGRLIRLVEKPTVPPSDLAMVGVYFYDATILKAARAIAPSARGELEISDATQWLVDSGYMVTCQEIAGWWKDTGRPEDMLEANRVLLDQQAGGIAGRVDGLSQIGFKVIVEPGADVQNSVIRGPAVIGSGTRTNRAYIGPFTSIGTDCVIEQCEIENSIVMAESRLIRIRRRISDSLIGRNVTLTASQRPPEAHKFVVGDNSYVEIE